MDNATITYGVAQKDDVPGILALYEQANKSADKNKIVILPIAIREGAIKASISAGHFFVAKRDGNVIAFKKAYSITDPEEQEKILVEELRFVEGKETEISLPLRYLVMFSVQKLRNNFGSITNNTTACQAA